jgi:hypothetical protein
MRRVEPWPTTCSRGSDVTEAKEVLLVTDGEMSILAKDVSLSMTDPST